MMRGEMGNGYLECRAGARRSKEGRVFSPRKARNGRGILCLVCG